jgi:ankyrin repeat protein/ABC-type dipeptide/oligopeptide/nickel transport system ATPase component
VGANGSKGLVKDKSWPQRLGCRKESKTRCTLSGTLRAKGAIMPNYLSQERIHQLVEALVECKLVGRNARDNLLAGIDQNYVLCLPERPSPLDQVRSDLQEMNTVSMLPSQQVPLRTWLGNAVAVLVQTSKPQHTLFQGVLDDVTKESEARKKSSGPQTQRGLWFLPPLPNNYVARADLSRLESILLAETGRYVGLVGMAGSGKSVLANALVRSSAPINEAFPGGIYWIARPDVDASILSYQKQLYLQLPGALRFEAHSSQEGLLELKRLAQQRISGARCLLVVDDPLESAGALAALDLGENAMFLVVAKDRTLLHARGVAEHSICELKRMEPSEGRELLARWVQASLGEAALDETALRVADQLEYLPVALAMVGALVAAAPDPETAWEDVLSALAAADLDDVSHPVDNYPVPGLPAIFDMSLAGLTSEHQQRLFDLAILPRRASVSLDQLYRLWEPLEQQKVRGLTRELTDKCLFHQTGKGSFALHSLLRLHIRRKIESLSALYERLGPTFMPDGFPLLLATSWQDREAAQSLIAGGANVNGVTSNGTAALHVAAERGDEAIAGLLIDAGATVDSAMELGFTPLHLAAQQGQTKVVTLLLEKGAAVDMRNEEGFASLHIAAQGGYADIAVLLLEHGATVNLQNNYLLSPLYVAAVSGSVEVVKALLEAAPLESQETDLSRKPLSFAVNHGRSEIVTLLIAAGADVNWPQPGDRATSLHMAALTGNTAIVKQLIAAGAKPDSAMKEGETPLHLAAQEGKEDTVRELLIAGASVDSCTADGTTPLHSAALGTYAGTVRVLVEAGAQVNRQDKAGRTPLFHAIGRLDDEITGLLLSLGAEVNVNQAEGYTPLHFAVMARGALMARQVNRISVGEKGSESMAMTEVRRISPATVVKQLVDAGADVIRPASDGSTALHLAAMFGDLGSMRILLDAGASRDLRDKDGKTPQDLAKSRNDAKAVEMLYFAISS